MKNKKIQTLRDDHALAHAEIEEAKAHGAMKQEAHDHGILDFIRLVVATINGEKIGDDES